MSSRSTHSLITHSASLYLDVSALPRRLASTSRSSSRGVGQMTSASNAKVFGTRVEKFLRERHPQKTAANVAALTGCSQAQVLKWLEGAATPNGEAIARLTLAYGPAFFAAFLGDLAPAWLNDDVREQRMNELQAKRAALDEELEAMRRG